MMWVGAKKGRYGKENMRDRVSIMNKNKPVTENKNTEPRKNKIRHGYKQKRSQSMTDGCKLNQI
jgi:hypothetical protein